MLFNVPIAEHHPIVLVPTQPYMSIALDVEGKGDEDIPNNGGDDADEGSPFS